MDIEKLRGVIKQHKLFVKETSKNIIAKCPYCGDHRNPRKAGHLYVSIDPGVPVVHCFYCNHATSLPKFISDLTGDTTLSQIIISKEEMDKAKKNVDKVKPVTKRFTPYKTPEIQHGEFLQKKLYLKKRSNNKLSVESIPNLVFDFAAFFELNKLDVVGEDKLLSNKEVDYLKTNFVGFLGRHSSTLFCRNIDPKSNFKFRKIKLQTDPFNLLDYWCVRGNNPKSKLVVLSEGIFDSIGEYVTNSLKLRNDCRAYAAGNSFSYSTLLKSVCFDENLFRVDVVILSDRDKKPQWYNKFKKENSHIIDNISIYVNKSGNDFGVFPQIPIAYI